MFAPDEAPGVLFAALSIALLVAMGVVAASIVWIGARFVSTRLENRYLGRVSRWSRRRAGVRDEGGPWACPACRSVSPATSVTCYRCGAARPMTAVELAAIAADDAIYHPPEPRSRFDPERYRGPLPGRAAGAPPDTVTVHDGPDAGEGPATEGPP